MDPADYAEQIETRFKEEKEQKPQNKGNIISKCREIFSERFLAWLAGFVVSCIPICLPPIIFSLFNETVTGYWRKTLSGAEIAFIGVTLCITAMYDLINQKSAEKRFPWSYLILLIIGVMFFAVISAAKELSSNFNYNLAILLNFIFLGAALLRGVSQYIKEYKEAQ